MIRGLEKHLVSFVELSQQTSVSSSTIKFIYRRFVDYTVCCQKRYKLRFNNKELAVKRRKSVEIDRACKKSEVPKVYRHTKDDIVHDVKMSL